MGGLFDNYHKLLGSHYRRILDSVVRQSDESAPLLVHAWPRESQTSTMWQRFFEHPHLLRDAECPLIPAVQLLNDARCVFVVTHSPPRACGVEQGYSSLNMRRRLERVRDAFKALAWLHQQRVSLNFIGEYDDTFVSSYAQRVGPEHVKRSPAGYPERFAFSEEVPEEPNVPYSVGPGGSEKLPPGLPWTAATANNDPRVPGPRVVSLEDALDEAAQC